VDLEVDLEELPVLTCKAVLRLVEVAQLGVHAAVAHDLGFVAAEGITQASQPWFIRVDDAPVPIELDPDGPVGQHVPPHRPIEPAPGTGIPSRERAIQRGLDDDPSGV
jgi:hypothetical protein